MGKQEWQTPAGSPWEIIHLYAKVLSSVPSAKAWARIEGTQVHFHTVIDFSKPEHESALYQAERDLLDIVSADAAVFHVYPAFESILDASGMIEVTSGRLVA